MTGHKVGRVYVINKKQAEDSGIVVNGTLTFNSTSFVVLFNSKATHSFISSKSASRIEMESHKHPIDLDIGMPTGEIAKCNTKYQNCPIIVNQEIFESDLIQLDLSEFDIILGIDWLSRHGAKIDCQKQRVSLKGKGEEKYILGETIGKLNAR